MFLLGMTSWHVTVYITNHMVTHTIRMSEEPEAIDSCMDTPLESEFNCDINTRALSQWLKLYIPLL